MTRYLKNPLNPQDAVALEPLQRSHEADQLETELKALFKLMFDTYIRPSERTVNTLGTPHIGPFDQVERAVKAEGLALRRQGSEDTLRYLFRAWRARNPKRGMHMLRAYLQLLWPNGWTMDQMWQDKAEPYPTLTGTDEGNHFLTSRISARISSELSDGSDILAAASALRSVVPARFLLNVSVWQQTEASLRVATCMYAGAVYQQFQGDFDVTARRDAVAPTGVANRMYTGSGYQQFSGDFV